jgi:hypothetical protein
MQRHLVGNKIVHYVSKPRCGIVSNVHQLLIRKSLRNGCGVLSEIHGQSRQMIGHHIFCPLLIPDFYVELLKQQNPTDQTGFSIFLGEKILQRCVIRIDNDFRSSQIRSKLVQHKNDRQQLLFCGGVIELGVV